MAFRSARPDAPPTKNGKGLSRMTRVLQVTRVPYLKLWLMRDDKVAFCQDMMRVDICLLSRRATACLLIISEGVLGGTFSDGLSH